MSVERQKSSSRCAMVCLSVTLLGAIVGTVPLRMYIRQAAVQRRQRADGQAQCAAFRFNRTKFDFSKTTSEFYGLSPPLDDDTFCDEQVLKKRWAEYEEALSYHSKESVFARERAALDLNYHGIYTVQRQKLQDGIVQQVVSEGHAQEAPWIVFTAGPMGAGKTHTVEWMYNNSFFPLTDIVSLCTLCLLFVAHAWSKRTSYSCNRCQSRIESMCLVSRQCHCHCYCPIISLDSPRPGQIQGVCVCVCVSACVCVCVCVRVCVCVNGRE
jgi:hypothetical protein